MVDRRQLLFHLLPLRTLRTAGSSMALGSRENHIVRVWRCPQETASTQCVSSSPVPYIT